VFSYTILLLLLYRPIVIICSLGSCESARRQDQMLRLDACWTLRSYQGSHPVRGNGVFSGSGEVVVGDRLARVAGGRHEDVKQRWPKPKTAQDCKEQRCQKTAWYLDMCCTASVVVMYAYI
jgi:hypothetical protein